MLNFTQMPSIPASGEMTFVSFDRESNTFHRFQMGYPIFGSRFQIPTYTLERSVVVNFDRGLLDDTSYVEDLATALCDALGWVNIFAERREEFQAWVRSL